MGEPVCHAGRTPDATLKAYPGAAHELAQVAPTKDQFNADLLNFLNA